VARVAGRYDDALALYADAVAMNDRIGARPFSALSRLGWARTLLARDAPGDGEEAARLLAAVIAELRRLDMPGQLAIATSALAAAERKRPAGPALSARELEVARLVAQARSNRQIAEQLVLSERTVESHVRNVLTKLGFSTRTEIATWIVQQDQRGAGPD
jgi:DNA-binding NarL/FixJ family response regulator